jgi:3,4-dihydroxy 2-butanone 4-phosphate synthase/GTP cyclohydrolase II
MAEARIPTEFGNFKLCLYRHAAGHDHVALILGNVAGRTDVLTRVHSECFTAEVMGSLRCDCAAQLRMAFAQIAQAGSGVVIYLRQEGRGIGLLEKLRAYNLQDLGHDTVDANLLLGHGPDERTYDSAASILEDLQIKSVLLLTNNPSKLDALRELGVTVTARRALVASLHPENRRYIATKVDRMGHQIELRATPGPTPITGPENELQERIRSLPAHIDRPFVTLSYAQSLDGCITSKRGHSLPLSGPETLTLTHRLRSMHDAILVGVGTVASDNPRLTVRLVPGRSPQPVVLDSKLGIPVNCRLLRAEDLKPLIATVEGAPSDRIRTLESLGARVLQMPGDSEARVDLAALLRQLACLGIRSVMIEGGVRVIRSIVQVRLVDYVVSTIALRFVGGDINARLQSDLLAGPRLSNFNHCRLGPDLVVWAPPGWD